MIQKNFHITSRDSCDYVIQNIATSREYRRSKTSFLLMRSTGVSTEEVTTLAKRIHAELPNIKVLGMPNITFNEEENRDETQKFIDISCTFYMDSEVHILYFPTSLDFKKLGQTIGSSMRDIKNLKGVGIFYAGQGTQLEEFLETATQGNEDIPFFGVLARDYETDEAFHYQTGRNLFYELACYHDKPFVVTDNRVSEDGLVLQLFIGENLHLKVDYLLGWKPIGRELKITAAEGTRKVSTINDIPAAEIYKKYLGVKPDSYFVFNVCEFPMIFNRNGGDIARVPPIFDKDGNLFFGGDIHEGEKFRFAYGNAHDMLYQTWLASEEMREFGPERVILHICGNRNLFLKGNAHIEIDDFKRFLPSTVTLMGAGEIYCYHGKGGILNSSIIAVGMREGDPINYESNQCTCPYEKSEQMIPLADRLAKFLEVTTSELKEMAIAAKEASRAKSSFLSNMSHEIRTPINAILGMNEMILRESQDSAILEYAENIRTASSTLLGLVNDILDFSKIEAGKMDIIPVDYDPSSLLNDLVNMIKTRAEKKGIEFFISCSPEIPSLLYGDEIRIKQIATNILTNAVKYTEHGCVIMSVGSRKVSDDEIDLIFSICDTGIGIKKEDISKLFSAFERIEEKRNRTIEGTGLGMNITQRLLELMNSKLKVESVYGEGSNFTFSIRQKVCKWIPIGDYQRAYHLMLQKHQVYHEKFTAPDAKILVVDDTPMNLKVIEGLLKQTKVQIDTAESGRESLELVKKNRYDLIFLDHRMPGMDGIETLKRMQNLEGNLNFSTPVISLTANAISGAREMYIKAGFDDYLTKPIHSDQLENLMIKFIPPEKILTIEDSQEEILKSREDEKIPDWLKNFSGVQIETGIENCGSVEGFLDALKIFYNSIQANADEIQKFFDACDFPNYTTKVHALKSSARIIGAIELSERAKRLEDAGNQGYFEEIYKDTPAMLDLYRKYLEGLSPLAEVEDDDSNLPEIDQSQLAEAYEAIREMSATFDYDSVQFVFESLKEFRIPAAQKDQLKKIKVAADKPDWEEVNNLLKAVVA